MIRRSHKTTVTSESYKINNIGLNEVVDEPKAIVINTTTTNQLVVLVRKDFLKKFSVSDGLQLLDETIRSEWGYDADGTAIYTDKDGYLQVANDKSYKYLSDYRFKLIYPNAFNMDNFNEQFLKAEEYRRKFVLTIERLY